MKSYNFNAVSAIVSFKLACHYSKPSDFEYSITDFQLKLTTLGFGQSHVPFLYHTWLAAGYSSLHLHNIPWSDSTDKCEVQNQLWNPFFKGHQLINETNLCV
jgi:hypothetical protein